MRSPLSSAARALVLVCVVAVFGTRLLMAQATERVSVDSQGQQGNAGYGMLSIPSLSADGRLVAFASYASNLVPGDTNGFGDVFVHDRQTGATTRVSVSSQGQQGNNESYSQAISGDGRFVAFTSGASDLVPGDSNGVDDVFVHDRQTGVTTRASVSSQGEQGDFASGWVSPSLSGDGRFVAFSSLATNLVASDTNGVYDVFVHDRQTGATTRVSVSSQGLQGNRDSYPFPVLSPDGRFVVFQSDASNLIDGDTNGNSDVFVHDRQTGDTSRVSVDSQGVQANFGAWWACISADGRYVAFDSYASNLVPDDTNEASDVFLRDRQTGVTTRVSESSLGGQAEGSYGFGSYSPTISDDGRLVAFGSSANNLVGGDTNDAFDIFVHDGQSGLTSRVSLTYQGEQADSPSAVASICANGRFIAFVSDSTNLVPDDTNNVSDAFVRDYESAPCSLPASWANYGSGWPGTNGVPALVATSNPILCATIGISVADSASSDTTGFLLVGLQQADLPTAWSGHLLVLPDLVIPLAVPVTGLTISASIPCDDSLCGLTLFAQLVEMDPGASRGVSFTPGLALELGVE